VEKEYLINIGWSWRKEEIEKLIDRYPRGTLRIKFQIPLNLNSIQVKRILEREFDLTDGYIRYDSDAINDYSSYSIKIELVPHNTLLMSDRIHTVPQLRGFLHKVNKIIEVLNKYSNLLEDKEFIEKYLKISFEDVCKEEGIEMIKWVK